jgi:hypothetical protein
VFWQVTAVGAQEEERQQTGGADPIVPAVVDSDEKRLFKDLLRESRGAAFPALIERIFGADADATVKRFDEDAESLLRAVTSSAGEKAAERLQKQIDERREKISARPIVEPKPAPTNKTPVKRAAPKSKRLGFNQPTTLDWRRFAFGFQPLPSRSAQEDGHEVKFKETDKELIAEGEARKNFETKEAKGTRTQKAESRYTKDGKTFGVEIKNTEIIEAVSKTDGKAFRTETVLSWGAEVAACPDAGGITSGTGKAKATVKTTLTENGQTVTLSTDLDLQAKLTGYVNDRAEFTNYDFQVDAYITNSGAEDAFRRNLTKEIKLRDGRHGIRYDIKGNTIEVRTGGYGSERAPAKFGKATGRKLTAMTDAEAKLADASLGAVVPAIWVQANNMYETAQKHWRDFGCVEVICKAPKTALRTGEQVIVSAETVHRQEGSKINAALEAEAGPGTVAPESQNGTPGAQFTFTKEGEESSFFTVRSISKRGIGEGRIEFLKEIEEPEEKGAWTGTIAVRRFRYEEREKRSGANLAENGGYFETNTDVKLRLTGRLDRTVYATNANIALVTGEQRYVDYEYDRYKVDEGYCGPNAVPYKGEKEINRHSKTTAAYNRETRAYIEIGGTGGTISFSLPEVNGTTVHTYKHISECAEHDRANTNEATDENTATVGGSFSFSFPIDPSQKTIRGTVTVTEEDGSKTDYTYELRRK